IDTDYGEKIGIDQSTCVSDTYCTKIMACPSFEKVIVTRSKPPIPRVKKISLDNIPAPTRHEFSDTWSAFISGVGGMGVGVLSSTLARAGTKEGYTVKFNDKKGLAIRNGAVSAHINYAKGNAKISTIVPNGKADLLLGLDMLEAERSLVYASRARTTAVVNSSVIPTIPMLAGMMNYPTDVEDNIRKHTNSDEYLSGRIILGPPGPEIRHYSSLLLDVVEGRAQRRRIQDDGGRRCRKDESGRGDEPKPRATRL